MAKSNALPKNKNKSDRKRPLPKVLKNSPAKNKKEASAIFMVVKTESKMAR